jgi:transcriptional regulator with XRE-family HTH domain
MMNGYRIDPRQTTVRDRELGFHLRRAMSAHGVTMMDAAAAIGCDISTVSRICSGRIPCIPVNASTILALCGVAGDHRERLLNLAYAKNDPLGFRINGVDRLASYRFHVVTASEIIEYVTSRIPWALQVPGYARTVLADSPVVPDAELAEWVRARDELDALLDVPERDRHPDRLLFLLPEWLLTTQVNSAEVMSDQLHHLLKVLVRPHVEVRIVPASQSGGGVPFTLLRFGGAPSAVYRDDTDCTGIYIEDAAVVGQFKSVSAHLADVALSPQRSREVIAAAAEEWSRRCRPCSGPARHLCSVPKTGSE